MKSSGYRVAYLASHPIQYQAPLLRYINDKSDIELTAFFLSDFSLRAYHDAGFNGVVQWDVPLVEGYKHIFLPALGSTEKVSSLRPFTYGFGRHLHKGNFDALWMHGYAHQANLRAMLVAKSRGLKVFIRADTHMAVAQGTPQVRRVKEAALRKLFCLVDGFLAAGSLTADYYRYLGVPENKIFSVPYAVDNEFFQRQNALADPHREQLRRELNMDAGRPIILFASKLIPGKRGDDLIQAYAKLSPDGKQEPRPYLVFVGDGPERSHWESLAQRTGWNSIRFLGFKNQTELPPLFNLCDVFVLPATVEAWGLVVNEVMNSAKPVIITNEVGAAPDLVLPGKNGFVIRAGDIEALTESLAKVVSNPEFAQSMGKASLEIVNRWSFQEDVRGLMQALQTTVGSKPALE